MAKKRSSKRSAPRLAARVTAKVSEFHVVIEQDADGWYVGTVPELPSCYTQGKSVDQLMERMREVVSLCLAESGRSRTGSRFVGIQRIAV